MTRLKLKLKLKITSGMLQPNGHSYDICVSREDHDILCGVISDSIYAKTLISTNPLPFC